VTRYKTLFFFLFAQALFTRSFHSNLCKQNSEVLLNGPGVDFTNILQATYTHKDPRSAKNIDNLTVFSALLGSARTKAALKRLVKLTPEVHFQTIESESLKAIIRRK